MNEFQPKGFLFFQDKPTFLREKKKNQIYSFDDISPDEPLPLSYAGRGWSKITHLIPRGEFVRIASERNGVSVDAEFNIKKNVPDGNNGSYTIIHGQFASNGTFLNVEPCQPDNSNFQSKDNRDYVRFYICHSNSSSRGGTPFLVWLVALCEFSN